MSLSNRKISSLRAVLLCLLAIGLSDPLFSQQPVPMSKDYAQWGCDFLQSLYPNVGIDKLVVTLEASNSFRNKAIFTRYFNLYVGEGEHGRTLGYIGGHLGEKSQDSPPSKELIYAKEYLGASFNFDSHDQLVEFGASGPMIGNPDALKAMLNLIQSHPEWAEATIVDELKQAGARFGPHERDEFIRKLPVNDLEKFLGKLTLTSAKFETFGQGEPRAGFLQWTVQMEGKRADGSHATYELHFEPFKGDLVDIVKQERELDIAK